MDRLLKDLAYSFRSLLKHPGFTLLAVLTLALGIGVNSALFTVFDAFVLKPLPLKDPDSLVTFDGADAKGQRLRLFSYSDYLDYRNQKSVLADVVAWNRLSVTLGDAPPNTDDETLAEGYEHLFGQIVSNNYFEMLGADMELGRSFAPTDETSPGTNAVVVLSHGFWERRFQSDRSIIGKRILLHGVPFEVVGVTSQSFVGTTPDVPSFWVPLMMRDQLISSWGHRVWLNDRNTEVFALIGRLAPGVSRQQAEASLQLTTAQLAQAYPAAGRKTRIKLDSGSSFVTLDGDVVPLVTPLALGFGLVLLISCANVANLLLVRAAGRQREIAVRLALGASRWRVVRQLITESLMLAMVGGLAGLVVATWTLSALYPIVLTSFPLPTDLASGFKLDITPDWRIFLFTLALASAAGVIAGLFPALKASRPDLIESLKDEGSTVGGSLRKSRLRNALVVAQIAVCFAILLASGLLVQNARRLQDAEIGMVTANIFSVATTVSSNANQKNDPALNVSLRHAIAERLRAMPEVASVSQVHNQPLSGQVGNTVISLDNGSDALVETKFNLVSPDYFQTMSLPILRGRSFTQDDVTTSAHVVVISETTASLLWPGVNALGKHIGVADVLANTEDKDEDNTRGYQRYEVIGVARDTRNRWIFQRDEKFLYLPLPSDEKAERYLLVRTVNDPGPVMAQTRSLVSTLHPRLRASVKSIDESLDYQTSPFRAVAWLSSVLGLLALLLSSVGLYGVVSFMVASRTREIGIRVALGARPVGLLKMFIFEGLRLTGIGVGCGLLVGAGITRLFAAVLIDLSSLDPLVYASVIGFLLVVALLATVIPAHRATTVDPIEALRYE